MRILIRGAGDLATGIAYELWLAGHDILMTEIASPLAVRRAVAFSSAVYEGEIQVEKARAVLVKNLEEALQEIRQRHIPVIVDALADIRRPYNPDVLVDAIMAKRNLGTVITDADTVIGIGPGFYAGRDCHYVIETQRGPELGRCIREGAALPDTGIPGEIGGYSRERLIQASADGLIEPLVQIGDCVEKGQIVALTGGVPVYAKMTGIIRGMLKEGLAVKTGLKIGDVDARMKTELCYTISDKSRRIGQGVLEALGEQRMR